MKKRFNYLQDEIDREEKRDDEEMKEANEERKNETEVLSKIELITGGRYRPVGQWERREGQRPDTGEEELELLIKWKNRSYYHLDWIFRSDFESLGQGVGVEGGGEA